MALSPEEFVRRYINAHKSDKTLKEFADELNTGESAVASRVRSYRIKGVKLPALKNSWSGINPEELNKLIEGDR